MKCCVNEHTREPALFPPPPLPLFKSGLSYGPTRGDPEGAQGVVWDKPSRTPCHRLRLRDPRRAWVLFHDHRVLFRQLALFFAVFFNDWGRDEDPRWFGVNAAAGLAVPTNPPH